MGSAEALYYLLDVRNQAFRWHLWLTQFIKLLSDRTAWFGKAESQLMRCNWKNSRFITDYLALSRLHQAFRKYMPCVFSMKTENFSKSTLLASLPRSCSFLWAGARFLSGSGSQLYCGDCFPSTRSISQTSTSSCLAEAAIVSEGYL